MEVIGYILLAIFIALLIATALTFAAGLFIALVVVSALLILYAYSRAAIRRWLFMRSVNFRERSQAKSVEIIEGEYKDLTDKK